MPQSVIITTEEYYDNQLYGQDGFLPIISVAVISASEGGHPIDADTITAVAVPTAVETIGFLAEVSTVTAVAAPTAVEAARNNIDSNTTTSAAVISAAEVMAFVDANTVTSFAGEPTSDLQATIDSAVVTSVSARTTGEILVMLDSASVVSFAVVTAAEGTTQGEVATVTSAAVISSSDNVAYADTNPEVSTAVIVAQEQYNTGNIYTDLTTVTAVAVPTAVDGKQFTDSASASGVAAPSAAVDIHTTTDTGTVTEFQAISAVDTREYINEATTATGAAAVATADTLQAVDAATLTSVASMVTNEGVPHLDSATVTAAAAPSSTETFSGNAIIETFVKSPVSSGWGTASVRGGTWQIINGVTTSFSDDGTNGKIAFASFAATEIVIPVPSPPAGQSGNNLDVGQLMQWQWNANNAGTSNPITIGGAMVWADTTNRYYYRVIVSQPVGGTHSLRLSLDKITAAGGVQNQIVAPFTVITTGAINTYYNLRVEGSGLASGTPTINAKLWLASGTEPTNPQLTYTDTTGVLPPQNANYGPRANDLSGDTASITLKFSSYTAYYL